MKTYKEKVLDILNKKMKYHSEKVGWYLEMINKYKKNGRVTPEIKRELDFYNPSK